MDKGEMIRLRLAGLTYRRIGDLAGVSPQRIQQLVQAPPDVREAVVASAEGKCAKCGLQVGRSGHVHHTGNAQEDYNDLPNLQLLCVACHVHAHRQAPKLAPKLAPKPAVGHWRHRDAQCAPASDALIHLLVAAQGATPDGQFAGRLALSRSMWQRVRTGQRRMGVPSLARVLRHYPELTGAVWEYIWDRNTE